MQNQPKARNPGERVRGKMAGRHKHKAPGPRDPDHTHPQLIPQPGGEKNRLYFYVIYPIYTDSESIQSPLLPSYEPRELFFRPTFQNK